MASSLFADINELKYSNLIERVEEYSNSHDMEIFIFQLPKSDLDPSSYIQEKCFMIMSVGYKIALVNGGESDSEFEGYCDDVRDIIGFALKFFHKEWCILFKSFIIAIFLRLLSY